RFVSGRAQAPAERFCGKGKFAVAVLGVGPRISSGSSVDASRPREVEPSAKDAESAGALGLSVGRSVLGAGAVAGGGVDEVTDCVAGWVVMTGGGSTVTRPLERPRSQPSPRAKAISNKARPLSLEPRRSRSRAP